MQYQDLLLFEFGIWSKTYPFHLFWMMYVLPGLGVVAIAVELEEWGRNESMAGQLRV